MISREKFKEVIYKIEELNEYVDELAKMKIDISESKFVDYSGIFFDELMRNEFGEAGLDLVSWWLYEDVDHKIYSSDHKAGQMVWYYPGEDREEGNVIADLNNIEDLYDYLVKNREELIDLLPW